MVPMKANRWTVAAFVVGECWGARRGVRAHLQRVRDDRRFHGGEVVPPRDRFRGERLVDPRGGLGPVLVSLLPVLVRRRPARVVSARAALGRLRRGVVLGRDVLRPAAILMTVAASHRPSVVGPAVAVGPRRLKHDPGT